MVKLRSPTYGQGRIQFMAEIDAIRAELQAGHTLTAVHAKRAKQLGVSYSAFTRLVDRYCPNARPTAYEKATHERDATQAPSRQSRTGEGQHEHTGRADLDRLNRLIKGN